jgi:hypothetical protein
VVRSNVSNQTLYVNGVAQRLNQESTTYAFADNASDKVIASKWTLPNAICQTEWAGPSWSIRLGKVGSSGLCALRSRLYARYSLPKAIF